MTKPQAIVLQGDNIGILRQMPSNSVDSGVTDPPSGTGFMNADWDKNKGGRDRWISWLEAVMVEYYRVLKPGAYVLVWALPRTSHWTATAVENAGFEIRDVYHHLFGQGFPKNLDVSKAIDEAAFRAFLKAHRPRAVAFTHRLWAATDSDRWAWRWCQLAQKRFGPLTGKRAVIGMAPQSGAKFGLTAELIDNGGFNDPEREEYAITAPATDEAAEWDGWGTALKPAAEHWVLARKPFKGPVHQNVLKHRTGGLNIGACRIGNEVLPAQEAGQAQVGTFEREAMVTPERVGRWPAHIALSHTEWCQLKGTEQLPGDLREAMTKSSTDSAAMVLNSKAHRQFDYAGESVEVWECAEGCPVRVLDEQSGYRASGKMKAGQVRQGIGYSGGLGQVVASDTYGDAGGASRFFYCPKPSRSEKEAGLEDLEPEITNDGRATSIDNPYQRGDTLRKNSHPTVKPVELIRYFARLITPPGGILLDPFFGSGSHGVAAVEEGFSVIGIEQKASFCTIARKRVLSALERVDASSVCNT